MSDRRGFLDKFICDLIGSKAFSVESALAEVKGSNFERELREELKGLAYAGWLTFERGRVLYVLTRLLRPEILVETGVFAGVSTAYILNALDSNGTGCLYSVDLPDPFLARYQKQPGFAVHEKLRDKWQLELGRSSDKLLPLLLSLGCIDFFLHDSEHSYQNMMFEFNTAWSFLRPGGILISHDIDKNNSFRDFCRTVGVAPVEMKSSISSFGAVLKPAQASI